MLHGSDIRTGCDGGDRSLKLMTGIGDELFLPFHIPDIGTDSVPGEEYYQPEYQKQASQPDK